MSVESTDRSQPDAKFIPPSNRYVPYENQDIDASPDLVSDSGLIFPGDRLNHLSKLQRESAKSATIDRNRMEVADAHVIIQSRSFVKTDCSDDIVRIFESGKGQYTIFLGDFTCSPGMKKLATTLINSQIDRHMRENESPEKILNELNFDLHVYGSAIDYMTGVIILLDSRKRRMIYSVAGHQPPLHLRWRGNTWKELPGIGIPLGVRRDETYTAFSFRFDSGDKILLISDGFNKIRESGRRFMRSTDAIKKLVEIPSDAAPFELMEGLEDIVDASLNGRSALDETTAALIQI